MFVIYLLSGYGIAIRYLFRLALFHGVLQYNLSGSNPDGSFTVDDSDSFFSLFKILPIAQENKYLMVFFSYFLSWNCMLCVLIRIASPRRF